MFLQLTLLGWGQAADRHLLALMALSQMRLCLGTLKLGELLWTTWLILSLLDIVMVVTYQDHMRLNT